MWYNKFVLPPQPHPTHPRIDMLPIRQSLFRASLTLLALAIDLAVASEANAQNPTPIHFETQVRGILKAHCFHCHGEGEHREAGLDLRLVHLMKKGGESGSAISPGAAKDSLLVQRIEAGEMPPGGKSIPEAQKEILRRWLDEGALTIREELQTPTLEDWTEEERSYWLFQPVAAVTVPTVPPEESGSASSAIDAFVLAKLREKQIPRAPTADRLTLIRRLSVDLLGVPPTQ